MKHLRLSQKIVTIVYGILFQLEIFHWPLKAIENLLECFLILFDSCKLIKKKFNLENLIRKHQMLKMTNKCPWWHCDAHDDIVMPITTLWCPWRHCDAQDDIVMPMTTLWCPWRHCDAHDDIVMPMTTLWCPWRHCDAHDDIVNLWCLWQNCEFVMNMTTWW